MAKMERRSPYGERGLKSLILPSIVRAIRRSPYGERGLKFSPSLIHAKPGSRSPYGERVLKSGCQDNQDHHHWSLPVWGAWIEILRSEG